MYSFRYRAILKDRRNRCSRLVENPGNHPSSSFSFSSRSLLYLVAVATRYVFKDSLQIRLGKVQEIISPCHLSSCLLKHATSLLEGWKSRPYLSTLPSFHLKRPRASLEFELFRPWQCTLRNVRIFTFLSFIFHFLSSPTSPSYLIKIPSAVPIFIIKKIITNWLYFIQNDWLNFTFIIFNKSLNVFFIFIFIYT